MNASIPVPSTTVKRRRWIKVDVEPDVFDDLHLRAAESRMRIQPYLRRYLSEARPYPTAEVSDPFLSFSSVQDSGHLMDPTKREDH